MDSYHKLEDKPLNPSLNRNNTGVLSSKAAGARVQQSHMTSAYKNFSNRLSTQYLIAEDIRNVKELEKKFNMIAGNHTRQSWESTQVMAYCGSLLLCIPLVYYNTRCKFQVEANHFALVASDSGSKRVTEIYGPGFHILGRYYELLGIFSFAKQYTNNLIVSRVGDLQIAIVDQGTIMHFEFGGQNVLLGPGVHKITDPLQFIKIINLDSFYIEIGAEKWVTIPDGYDGISINLGEIRILHSGMQHHLSHVGDKFVKMIPKTLLTDRIPTDIVTYVKELSQENVTKMKGNAQIQQNKEDFSNPARFLHTTTAEGSPVSLEAMVFWKITNSLIAARNAMEILVVEEKKNQNSVHNHADQDYHIREASANINYLRITILRIIKNHLTAQVGACSLASDFSLGAVIKKNRDPDSKMVLEEDNLMDIVGGEDRQKMNSFDMLTVLQGKQNSLVEIINKELQPLGVKVENLCIYCVKPSPEIQRELDRQTKAKVDANTAIIEVNSMRKKIEIETKTLNQKKLLEADAVAKTIKIQADTQASTQKTKAEGQAEAIRTIARARKEEADELEKFQIAKDLARIRAAGESGEKIFGGAGQSNFVFGQNPGDILFSAIQQTFSKK